jgi:tRNA uridine 5-carboxymethylaminomethyl modification enzyme
MFTSRAEFRLHLREDNADFRLGAAALALDLYDENAKRRFEQRQTRVTSVLSQAKNMMIGSGKVWAERLTALSLPETKQGILFSPYCHRQDVDMNQAVQLLDGCEDFTTQDWASLKAEVHYDGYLDKQELEVKRFRDMEHRVIPEDLDYSLIKGLSIEGQQKLAAAKPANLGQASRVSGVTPAAMTSVMIYLQQTKES